MDYICADCGRWFSTRRGLESHCMAKGHSFYECSICDNDRVFVDRHALDQHQKSVHEFCYSCSWAFASSEALSQHYETFHRDTYCRRCGRNFGDGTAKAQHIRDSRAHQYDDDESDDESDYESDDGDNLEECNLCDEIFWDEDSLDQHLRYQHPFCVECSRAFNNEHALDEHLRYSFAHKQVVSRAFHNTFCPICEKEFRRPEDLQRHNSSFVHRARDTPCIACPSKFKTPSGLAQHIESNCSQLPLSRNQVTGTIQSLKIASKISLRPSIEGGEGRPRPSIVYHGTENTPNRNGYQCQICNKAFSTFHALEAHLNSPVHDEDEFKCPKCDTQFKLVSGLVQHLESGSCGLSSIDDVERRFERMTARFSRSLVF